MVTAILDTNVFIRAALRPRSPSARVVRISANVAFFTWIPCRPDAMNATITTMKTAVLPPATEAAIWARVIHPNGELTPAVARAILQLEFTNCTVTD